MSDPGPRQFSDAVLAVVDLLESLSISYVIFGAVAVGVWGRILYARAGLADYRLLNLVDRVLEVHREPVSDAEAPFGWRYARCDVFGATSQVAPLARPSATVRVSQLLP